MSQVSGRDVKRNGHVFQIERICMRTFKVALIVFIAAGIFYFLFNYYIPSRIDASGPAKRPGEAKIKIGAPPVTLGSTKDEGKKEEEKSIALELGIPEPVLVTYEEIDPKNIKKSKKTTKTTFDVPEEIETEVNFWKDVYTKYDKTKVVFHDRKHLDIIYSVIDISDIVDSEKLTDEEKWQKKKAKVRAEESRLVNLLNSMDGKKPEEMNKEEKEIYALFKNVNERNKFKKAAASDRLRSQTGIAEKFREGIVISGKYMGEIEKIFAEYKIPLEITRLVFVESMFNLNAVSKVGASGIWQFMPSTGKMFVTMNEIVDERNDPIKATHAAAKHLRRDYDIVGTWPLAINSYNSGRGRLERAVRVLGTKKIGKIIKNYNGSGYGFASRNFYPAFLAALNVFENREAYFGVIKMEPPLTFDVIQIPFFTTFPELAKYTGVPIENLVLLNPFFQDNVVEGSLPIPIGFSLKVPAGLGEKFLVAINEMDRQDKYAKWHIVDSGENMKRIAAKYNTTRAKIKKVNRLKNSHLKAGQILKLPSGIALAKE